MQPRNVLVIGGGWAGLTAAIQLVDQGIPVTLIEAAPQLGGRARTITFSDKKVDNGQHLMIGAYHRVRNMMQKIGLSPSAFHSTPLQLNMYAQPKKFNFRLPDLPQPFHVLAGILCCNTLPLREKWALLKFCRKLAACRFEIKKEMSVSDFLYQHQITPILRQQLFEPLCLAALSTPPSYASAELFLCVLRDTFAGHHADTRFLFATQDLDELFPLPAKQYIESRGGKVLTHTRAQALMPGAKGIEGVKTNRGWFLSEHIILATTFQSAAQLLSPLPSLNQTTLQLQQLKNEQITTVYLQFAPEVKLAQPMVGLTGTWSQWIFDRRFANQPGLMAVVMTGIGPHLEVDNKVLITQVTRELQTYFPQFNAPLKAARVIREKQAAFSCRVGVNAIRPHFQTPMPGLWLAGDYTQTGYPATLEGAVKSGQQCVEQVIKALK